MCTALCMCMCKLLLVLYAFLDIHCRLHWGNQRATCPPLARGKATGSAELCWVLYVFMIVHSRPESFARYCSIALCPVSVTSYRMVESNIPPTAFRPMPLLILACNVMRSPCAHLTTKPLYPRSSLQQSALRIYHTAIFFAQR